MEYSCFNLLAFQPFWEFKPFGKQLFSEKQIKLLNLSPIFIAPVLAILKYFKTFFLNDQLYSSAFQNALRCYCGLKIGEVIQI